MPDIIIEADGVHALHGMRIKPFGNHLKDVVEGDFRLLENLAESVPVVDPNYPDTTSMQFHFTFPYGSDAIFTDYNGYFINVLDGREKELFGIEMTDDERFSHRAMGSSLLMFSISGKTRDNIIEARDKVVSKFPGLETVTVDPEYEVTKIDELINVCRKRNGGIVVDCEPLELRGLKYHILGTMFAKSRLCPLSGLLESEIDLRSKITSRGITSDESVYFAKLDIPDLRGEVTLLVSETTPSYDHSQLFHTDGARLNPKQSSVLSVVAISEKRELVYEYSNKFISYVPEEALDYMKATQAFIAGEIEDLKETLEGLELQDE
jgi:hypothetical protein